MGDAKDRQGVINKNEDCTGWESCSRRPNIDRSPWPGNKIKNDQIDGRRTVAVSLRASLELF